MTQLTSAAFSTAHPLAFARGRNGDVYAINGENRGLRWDGISAAVEQIGLTGPPTAPTVTASATSPKYYLSAVHVTDAGNGYQTIPTVTFSGSGGAVAKAELLNGGVQRILLQDYGAGYTAAPDVTISAPDGPGPGGSGATLTPVMAGRIASVTLTNVGSGYTSEPDVSVSGGSPTTAAILRALITDSGELAAVIIVNAGAGYTAAPTISFSGGDGSGAAATADVSFAIASVTVTAAGSGYRPADPIRVTGSGGGAFLRPTVDSAGTVTAVTVVQGGAYTATPTVTISPSPELLPRIAKATAVARPAIAGKYWCAIRYVDDTAEDRDGPVPSSISPLAEVTTTPAGSLAWSWSNSGMEARAAAIELWRTTSDQALVLYRVATVATNVTSYTDTAGDSELINPDRLQGTTKIFGVMPIVLPNGQVNARRFNPPPRNKRVITMFQDRAWYAVDVPGRTFNYTSDATHAEPNSLYFSEVDEPESVPETNELVIQENVKGQDRITALMPFGGGMVVFQTRHAYRLSYAAQPVIDSSIQLITQRGCLNQRCWDVHEGVAYVADSLGMYILEGTSVAPISDPVETFWTDGGIDFTQSKWFFVRVDPATKVVRFFYAAAAGFPDRALCYHPVTQAWWSEVYAQTFAAAECLETGGRQRLFAGGQSGTILAFDSGPQDRQANGDAAAIACTLRTGNMALAINQNDRNIRLIYKPTSADCNVSLALHYNNSASPRPAAVASDRGGGFTTTSGGAATLNIKASRSPLGDATGYAVCHYAGRVDDRSAGGDRHLALAISATRPAGEPAVLYGVAVAGAG